MAKKHIEIIHNGLQVGEFVFTDANREHGLVTMVATLSSSKDHKTLIQAFKRVVASYPGARLYLAGDGMLRADLEQLVASLGLSSAVTFLGALGRDEVIRLLRSAEIFVLSTKGEGCPLAILEAMASGVSIVATTAPGVIDVIENGANGLLVPPWDPDALAMSIIALLKNPELRNRLATNARRWVETNAILEHTIAGYAGATTSLIGPAKNYTRTSPPGVW
jgi:glycosyltransferase involved in cell wall biosynthesis